MAAPVVVALLMPFAVAAQGTDIPDWLAVHVGPDEGQIAPVVLHRARALHQSKVKKGLVKNPCYLAMDATRPSTLPNGAAAKRFFVICEADKTFWATSSGYGNGRKLKAADFSNGRQCAKHFSNAEGSKLSAGGAYLTAESRASFKGYYNQSGQRVPFYRTFLLFDGEGETRNARERAIGGHQAIFLRWTCRFKKPDSPHADAQGYVRFGRLVDYTSGRSNGCTTWSARDTKAILDLVEGQPTTLYLYPESKDIDAVARAVKANTSLADSGAYWNATCLDEIGAPKFWPKRQLQPIINRWRRSLAPSPARVLPVCE